MAEVLHVYSDASVRGRVLPGPKRVRSRRGPAFGAWCGWHGEDATARPTFAGQAYLGGDKGTQTAEYLAVVYALGAAVAYGETRSARVRPDEVRLYVDNQCVYHLMVGEWRPGQATGLIHRRADALVARLHELGMPVGTVKVPESERTHKLVHSMSQQARNQVLVRQEWRPDYEGPSKKKRKPVPLYHSIEDIPF